jgi:DNA-binding MurR/RpiR family transcriptional regulator
VNFPPRDFEQLRHIIILIQQGELDLPMGRKIFRGLEAMINEPELVASSNIVELSRWVCLSPASITRLSKILGFQGFNQFKNIFKQKSKLRTKFYSSGVEELIEQRFQCAKDLLTQQFQMVKDNITHSINNVNEADLLLASTLLAKKRRIFIFGYRQSSTVANILKYGLTLIRHNVQLLVQADHGLALALSQLQKEDLLVVIGSAPYSDRTLKVTALVQKQGCQILVITDSELSPLRAFSAVSLQIPTGGQFYANSAVASAFMIESLLCLTATQLGQVAVSNLQKHEILLSNLDVST